MPEPVFTHLVGLGDVDTHFPVGIGRGNAAMLPAKRALVLPFGNLGIRLGGEEVKADCHNGRNREAVVFQSSFELPP